MSATGLTTDYIKGWRNWSDLHHPGDFEAAILRELFSENPAATEFTTMNVLEIGCGDGRVMRQLSPLCNSVIGVDTNSQMIQHLQNELSERIAEFTAAGRLNLSFEEMSGTDLKFKDESFDLVLYPWSLHQIKDKHTALSEARRVLQNDGHLVVFGLLPGGEYENTAESLGLDACPAIDCHESYEKPLAQVFGTIVARRDIGPEPEKKEFGFRFHDAEEALQSWIWALINWHEHTPSESDLKRLRERMNGYKRSDDIFMPIRGKVFLVRK